jgi:uncharacterized protein YaeQ
MATGATIYRLKIDLADVDRDVYAALDLRLACHPSENMRHLLARTIAYCLCYEEGIAFGRGVSSADEPAVSITSMDGILRAWIDVGTPSWERLHKASKAARRVVVFTHNPPALLAREVRGKTIHRAAEVEVYPLDPAFLDALGEATDRNSTWSLSRSDGHVYVTVGGRSFECAIERVALEP